MDLQSSSVLLCMQQYPELGARVGETALSANNNPNMTIEKSIYPIGLFSF
jgi:hypothetical protein